MTDNQLQKIAEDALADSDIGSPFPECTKALAKGYLEERLRTSTLRNALYVERDDRLAEQKVASDQAGVSLRDHFAAKVMHAELLSAGSHPHAAEALVRAAYNAGQTVQERIAALSFQMADEMLKARTNR